MQDVLIKQGAEPVGNGPQEFTAFIRYETAQHARVVREASIKAESLSNRNYLFLLIFLFCFRTGRFNHFGPFGQLTA